MGALVALTVLLDTSASGAEVLARGITLPTYLPDGSLPAVVTRMAWMEKDYYQRGFLQFGMLPITVGRDVVMEVRQPEALAAALEGIQGWRKAPGKGRAVELRDFCLKLRLPDGPHELRAGRVRFGERGAVFLASDQAAQVNAQVFAVRNNEIKRRVGKRQGRHRRVHPRHGGVRRFVRCTGTRGVEHRQGQIRSRDVVPERRERQRVPCRAAADVQGARLWHA